jgi:hypothetical protein
MTTRIPKQWVPTGAIVPFMEAVAANPTRQWSYPEIARVMGIPSRRVSATVLHVVERGLLFRGGSHRETLLSGVPFPEPAPLRKSSDRPQIAEGWVTSQDDIRVQKVVPGWTPPKMIPPRAAA